MKENVINYVGYSMNIAEWAESIGINRHTLAKRVRAGWRIETALTYQLEKLIEKDKKNQFLKELANRREKKWMKRIDEGVGAWQELMLLRGYFRKETRIKAYKQLKKDYEYFKQLDQMRIAV